MSQRILEHELIERFKKVHNSRYSYPDIGFTTMRNQVCIICPIHGSFKQRAANHAAGNGCNKCFHEQKSVQIEEFIHRSELIHCDKYDYSQTVITKSCFTILSQKKFLRKKKKNRKLERKA